MNKIVLNWHVHDHDHTLPVGDGDRVLIGRRSDCQVVLPSGTISRQHALVFAEDTQFYVRNLSRTNPVRVNDDLRLTHRQTARLQTGDVLRIGPVAIAITADPIPNGKTPKIRCINCRRVVDYEPEGFCSWCGTALAAGQTVFEE